MTATAVLRSDLNLLFTDRRSLLWHGALMLLGPILVLLLWPTESLSVYLSRGEGPGSLAMAGISISVSLAVLSGGFGLDQVPRKPVHAFIHWYRYTPAGPGTYLAGRLLLHLCHSFILVLLLLPSLAVAAVPSRANPAEVLALAGFIVFMSFALRSAAELGRNPVKPSNSVAYLGFVTLLAVFLIATYSSLRNWSPLEAVAVLARPAREEPGTVLRASILLVLVLLTGCAGAWFRLVLAERVEKVSSG